MIQNPLHHCSTRSNVQNTQYTQLVFVTLPPDLTLGWCFEFLRTLSWVKLSVLEFDRNWAECSTTSSIWSGRKSSNSSYYLISAKNKATFFS